ELRPHWSYLLDSLKELGPALFDERQSKALRILRDDGATYNIYSDSSTPSHTWNMDLVPYVIGSEEWGRIEAGLLERAELFNLLLRDLYGNRELIRSGVIPPDALFCHRGFLRAC
ncbi:circularly permuted type 2 ATP-grasp protein, partial [Wenyingzhuangia sp. 1_MG-2023]|nr:circularly permuted type 2 ATP-grasp protein [Wenyingzhuangia sp. 1_MG-2023]